MKIIVYPEDYASREDLNAKIAEIEEAGNTVVLAQQSVTGFVDIDYSTDVSAQEIIEDNS
ncbi:MAG: hypothetical protein QM666_04465 [Acinetobacter sp.]